VQKDFCNKICQFRPHALQQTTALFDRLVGAARTAWVASVKTKQALRAPEQLIRVSE
jgi:hypothetical protein